MNINGECYCVQKCGRKKEGRKEGMEEHKKGGGNSLFFNSNVFYA
jgi:hypothetical protein